MAPLSPSNAQQYVMPHALPRQMSNHKVTNVIDGSVVAIGSHYFRA